MYSLRYIWIFLTVLLGYGTTLSAQTSIIDSLRNEIQAETVDSVQAKLFYQISYYLMNQDLAEADSFIELSMDLAEKTQDPFAQSKAYYLKGAILHRMGNSRDALLNVHLARRLVISLKKNKEFYFSKLSGIYNLLSTIHIFIGQADSALLYGMQSLELAEQQNSPTDIAIALFSVGNIHESQEQNDKAKEYYLRAESIIRPLNTPHFLGPILYALGSMSQGEERLTYTAEAIKIFEQIGHITGIATAKTSLGAYYVNQANRPDLAIEHYREAYKLFAQLGESYGITSAKTSLIQLWITLGYVDSARAIIDETLEVATVNSYVKMLPDLHQQKVRLAAIDGNMKELDRWLDSLEVSVNTIFDEAQAQLQTEADTKYQTSKKEAELSQQSFQLEQERSKRLFQTIAALLIILLLIGAFLLIRARLHRQRQQAEFIAELERNKSQKLRELDEMKTRFFTNISHEFRTPLTLLLGPIRQMQEGNFKGNLQHYLRIMNRNGERLENLIDQLLDLARLDSGKMPVSLQSGDLVEFLKIQAASFESWAARKDIDFFTHYPDEEISCAFDSDKLSKILNNLLSNAFKYTPEEGRVSFMVSKQNRQLSIVIRDTGYGIPEEELPHIFDRFTTGDQTQDGISSSGIGLALTKELVEVIGASIEVTSQVNLGTTFSLIIPIMTTHAETRPWRIPTSSTSELEIDGTPSISTAHPRSEKDLPTLLITEDNPDLRTYIADQFQDQYHLILAEDGQIGWDQAIDQMPDLIITDLMMPKMDGMEFTKRLKTDLRTSHIPVIMLTAKAEQSDKLAGLELGADDYLTKPFHAVELQVRAANLVEQRRRLRERFGKEGSIKLTEVAVTSADQQFLDRLVAVIEERMADEDLSVVDISESMHLSRSQLHRKLKALTDTSPSVFLRTIRLHRAKDLLEQKAGGVSEICYRVGFSSLAYFSKTFKDEFGMRPSELVKSSKPQ